jgi:hypothetical protein
MTVVQTLSERHTVSVNNVTKCKCSGFHYISSPLILDVQTSRRVERVHDRHAPISQRGERTTDRGRRENCSVDLDEEAEQSNESSDP